MSRPGQKDARGASESSAESLLRSVGLRRTQARILVLSELGQDRRPRSHAEVASRLVDAGIDRATVYRNLVDFTEAGLVERSDLGDHVWRFALRDQSQAHKELHPHFVCVACGAVACLPEAAVVVRRAAGTPRALASREIEVHVRGRCDACA